MKTSIILIALILINTSALISEPLANLVKGIDAWLLICIEISLVIGYYINKTIKELRDASHLDCNNLNLFVIKDPNKKSS